MAGPRRHRFRALIATLACWRWPRPCGCRCRWPRRADRRHRPKPTVVLVHGAWADSSSWSEVVRRLQSDGYTVEVPPNPLRGLASDAAYLSAYLQTIVGPIVLVGHSYGGAVITNAAAGNANVKALVYVNAFIPEQGETVVQLASAQPGSALAVADPTTVFRLVPYPGQPTRRLRCLHSARPSSPTPSPTTCRSAPPQCWPQPSARSPSAPWRPRPGPPAWRSIPSWALVGTRTACYHQRSNPIMAERARAHIVKVNASHLSMISRPKEVADLIRDASHATQ